MKILIFVLAVTAILVAWIWKMRKDQAKELLAQRDAIRRRREKEKKAVTAEMDMVWPVIIKPVKGQASGANPGDHGEEEEAVEEPTMTAIEYKAPHQAG